MKENVFVPLAGPPKVKPPSREIYSVMGEKNIFKMLEDFYLEVEKSPIRNLFPKDIIAASKKSAAFFVQLFGGPPLYQQLYGPPRLRARHLVFSIDEQARQIWVQCFEKTRKKIMAFHQNTCRDWLLSSRNFPNGWLIKQNKIELQFFPSIRVFLENDQKRKLLDLL